MLKRYFGICVEEEITLNFKQIEEIEGRKLHSASKRADFWSDEKKVTKLLPILGKAKATN